MSKWQEEPPTYQQWKDADNHGAWWIKYCIVAETVERTPDGEVFVWPEAWVTEVVTISVAYEEGFLLKPEGALHAYASHMKSFSLDDKDKIKGLYWQACLPPADDVKDKGPEC
jgi:hypothetical protein